MSTHKIITQLSGHSIDIVISMLLLIYMATCKHISPFADSLSTDVILKDSTPQCT